MGQAISDSKGNGYLDGGVVSKYVLYALGEILLVMIGILLALQVNNWSESRRARLVEKSALTELLNEFEQNRIQFDEVMLRHMDAKRACFQLQDLVDRGFRRSEASEWERALYDMSFVYTFNPSSNIVRSLISTANYEKVENDSLRILLVGWSDLVEDFQEDEIWARDIWTNQFHPYLNSKVPVRIYEYNEFSNWNLDDPFFDTSSLSSMEFNNHLAQRYDNLINIELEAIHVDRKMKTITRLIQKELSMLE